MIDRIKTIVLVILICGSLFQTYLLMYGSPQYEPITIGGDYVKPEKIGEKIELEKLIFPDYMLFHNGSGKHTMLYPQMGHYNPIMESLKQRSFEGFRKVNPLLLDINWEDVRNKNQGVELHFRDGISLQILQKVFQLKDVLNVENDIITNIWMFATDAQDEVRVFFFTDSRSEGYELIRTDFTVKDIHKFIGWGEFADTYYTKNGDYYLPEKSVKMPTYKFNYTVTTDEQLKRLLFVDPGIVRSLKESGGSQIYTDGKKGLLLNRGTNWIKYTDPITPVDSMDNVWENLMAGVQFINQHGGSNGGANGSYYGLSQSPHRKTTGNAGISPQFVFRQYFGSHPIIEPTGEGFGLINLVVLKGMVTNYDRSTVVPDDNPVQGSATLPSGEEVEARLADNPKRFSIVAIFPAYRSIISDTQIELQPTWVIKYRDGKLEFLQ
ncbi:hypothetical protein E0485_16615 [Paenibacillus albiflavus]|uniref:Regulatory protein YycH domain-containing protein n=1 Tax=Paenibacillus albiflavus TaxID=2545760 RepID=A0A4R4E843_9BACL|nr:two-component system activity regulator YycH [Paenibacillus albiflavus]TCZ75719.1 hypothetical protein E0485_16615 [Paenibacillus albiflavus]